VSAAVAGWLVEALVASTVLMGLVLLLRTPVRRAFGPDVAYALWALPLLRLLLPPLPAEWREMAAAPIGAASETITIYVVQPLSGAAIAAPAESALPLGLIIAAAWAVGAAAFLIWHATQHLRFCRRMLQHQIRGSEIDGIHLIETAAASGPLAFGLVRKYVAFPRDFVERYDQEERDLALAHEIGHHARGDLFANWLALGVLALHWFNPIAWRAFRAFRADQEIANDARVLAGLGAIARHSYACAIVKSAHGGAVSAACHLHTIDDLKGRLKMLTTKRTSRSRLIGGSGAVAALTIAGLGLTASGTMAAETVRQQVETRTGVNLAEFNVVPPAPPAPPAAPAARAGVAVALADLPDPPAAPEPPAHPASPTSPTPPAPPAPPALAIAAARHGESRSVTTTRTTGDDGKVVTQVDVVVRDKDGKIRRQRWNSSADIPDIKSGNCPGATQGKEMVINEVRDGKRRITICTNRIDAAAAHGAAMAAHGRAMAANGRAMAVNARELRREALQAAAAGRDAEREAVERAAGITDE
jgi:bla regulator protein BlaR1